MRGACKALLPATIVIAACASSPDKHTLAELRNVEPEVTEVQVENSLEQAIRGYRVFLEEVPDSALTAEAMRRLADLKIEKEYGILGGQGSAELPAPEGVPAAPDEADLPERPRVETFADDGESAEDFERRASGPEPIAPFGETADLELPGGRTGTPTGPQEAIELYDQILAEYPAYPFNDQVLYQKARAYDELGRIDEAMAVMERLVAEYPHSGHIDEVQFRRAEYFFMRRRYLEAEQAYSAIADRGPGSEYYELALYKLGWTFYKQELHEEALDSYVALLDYKVSTGYDFDQPEDDDEESRIADTYRVISLSFSNLGGPEVVREYFSRTGQRSYEDRIYSRLGEFYLEKLRYHDAAAAYKAFVEQNPIHRASPHFSMRVVEIYEQGDFPKLVLESKREFAATYGLQSEYWRHFDVDDSPEVLSYLKANLRDLAGHYHALYQDPELADQKPPNFEEASRWYRAYLSSFPEDTGTPAIHYRLADLLLEHGDFAQAAIEYERTAYDYPEHDQAAAAGYAAIYAHRENQKVATGAQHEAATRDAVASTLKFVDTYPHHDQAAPALGAAVDDLYAMKEFALAIATARRLIDDYPDADLAIRRSAWAVVAHASFDIADYPGAERAYARVLEMTPDDDESRQDVIDNLAASIYKQGEQASLAEDHRAAADHFLRIGEAAPTSEIRPAAEYDAGAALARLEDWAGAARVLESFREAYPDHELHREATKQMAFVFRQEGDAVRAAAEYERVAAEAQDPEVRREALLLAGELYETAKVEDRALDVYLRYVSDFASPIETAVETRFKIAQIFKEMGDEPSYHEQLGQIVEVDAAAGDERTPRIRYLAAQSALVLTEGLYHRFEEVELVQPFEQNLQEKQWRMNAAIEKFSQLVDYEVAEVTAAATFYMAEVYSDFSQSLIASERPAGLDAGQMQEYEIALEEEAFPFEERAIEVHEKNLELMGAGIYNAWIAKSLDRLADLVPGRYAKFETSSGLIASIDRYAYQPPTAHPADAGGTERVESEPIAPARAAERLSVDVEPSAPAGTTAESENVEVAPSAPASTQADSGSPEGEPSVPAAPADDSELGEGSDPAQAAPKPESSPRAEPEHEEHSEEPAGATEGSDAKPE
jgi:TolA-binding protein